MPPRYRTRPIDHIKPMESLSTIDPAAVQWHDFAAKEMQQEMIKQETIQTKQKLVQSNSTLKALPSPTFCRTKLEHATSKPKQQSSSDSIVSEKLRLIPDPPLCFCGKLASRRDTAEFGVVFDCHYMSTMSLSTVDPPQEVKNTRPTKRCRHICGFHIHQRPWDHYRQELHDGKELNPCNSELNICPAFNFTFCVVFSMTNIFRKSSPLVPKCFCNVPVILRELDNKGEQKIAFTCANFDVEGAKPRCSWFLWAGEVPFDKPKHSLHSSGNYQSKLALMQRFDENKRVTPPEFDQKFDIRERSDHQQSLLCALTSSSGANQDTRSTSEENTAEGSTNNTANVPTHFSKYIQLLSAERHPHTKEQIECKGGRESVPAADTPTLVNPLGVATTDPKLLRDEEERINSSSYVPVSTRPNLRLLPSKVYIQKVMRASLSLEKSSKQKPNIGILEVEHEEWKRVHDQIKELKTKITAISDDKNQIAQRLEKLHTEQESLKSDYQHVVSENEKVSDDCRQKDRLLNMIAREKLDIELMTAKLQRTLDEEIELRQNSQRKATDLEALVRDLVQETEYLAEENERNKEKAEARGMKCRVCFNHNIEFAIVPCFHCGKKQNIQLYISNSLLQLTAKHVLKNSKSVQFAELPSLLSKKFISVENLNRR
ncbi:hypothetical protein DFQ28_006910 [Apophysomyces sp. BC1034]|nr:hypothetical protein DFQ28_006910 [Apophysomyces sp. BC1034]